MNIYYAKAVLYAYPNITAVLEQIDELVEKKALVSMNDYTPALKQYEKIVSYTEQKDMLIDLQITVDKILTKFNDADKLCLDYKYFHRLDKNVFVGFDYMSRTYFRRQVRIAKEFSDLLEKKGITDKVFKEKYLKIEFFCELVKRVIEYEGKSIKNKKAKQKYLLKKSA